MNSKLKAVMFEEDASLQRLEREQVEVIGDTIDESLRLASKHLGKEIHQLDYEVIKRGKKGIFFSEPFHIRVFPANPDENIQELQALDEKLTGGSGKLLSKELKTLIVPKDVDGTVIIKNYRHGLYFKEVPPQGSGKRVTIQDINRRLVQRGIPIPKEEVIQKFLDDPTDDYVRMGDAKLKPFAEAACKVEVNDDHMKALVTLIPPKPGGRDLEVSDVVYELKKEDIVYGIKEDEIRKALESELYNEQFVGAAGDPPVHGKNAQITYHVRTEKKIVLKEDSYGRVNYKDLDLIENVVVGQLLAEKTPPEKGKYGRNLFNEMLEAKDGLDVQLQQGKGTILSEDKNQLTAEVNGQVVYKEGRLSVEQVLKIAGDVNRSHVTFLGSIIITGNVEDNFHIKAAGNIEIYGTVQKAQVEADGDIIIRQGVAGRGEARIETTGGNIISKFLQDAIIITDKDVICNEAIMNCDISAGGKVVCKGKKAQILGGSIKAGSLVLAKVLGSSANPQTEFIVGINPKLLKQVEEYEGKKRESVGKLEIIQKTYKTYKARKEADPGTFTEQDENQLTKLEAGVKKLEKRIAEFDKEIQTVKSYMQQTAEQGKVAFEKKMFPGVSITIKDSEAYSPKNEVTAKTIYYENGRIQQRPYSDPEAESKANTEKKKK